MKAADLALFVRRYAWIAIAALGVAVVLGDLRLAAARARMTVVDVARLGDRSLHAMACDDAGLWIQGWSRAPLDAVMALGVARTMASQHATVVRVSRTGEIFERDLGEGLISGFSETPDGAVWVVLLDVSTAPTERSRTLVSADHGVSWTATEAPTDVSGVAFVTGAAGYAWSARRVYRTDDAGRSWRSRDLGPFVLHRGGVPGAPRLAPDGRLWIPLDRPEDVRSGPAARLVAVAPDLSVDVVAEWDADRLLAIAPTGSSAVLAELSPPPGGHRLERVTARGSVTQRDPVRGLRRGALHSLQARGTTVLVHCGREWTPRGVFSTPPAFLEVSTTSGADWDSTDVGDEVLTSACLAPHGVWTVSERTQRVAFRPLE